MAPKSQPLCITAKCTQVARNLQIWRRKYIEEAEIVHELRKELLELREELSEQKTKQEDTDAYVRQLEQALAEERKRSDQLVEELALVEQNKEDTVYSDREGIDAAEV